MKKALTKLKALMVGLSYALVSGAPVLADDTEIYFGGGSASSGVYPNVMFVLDTSGSMRNEVSGTGKSRMATMQEAMNDILDTITGVNVGLMRFNNPGGPVLYPVSYIDNAVTATTTTDLPDVNIRLSDSADDAEQVAGSGEVILDSTELDIAVGPGSAPSGTTLNLTVTQGTDDAFETTSQVKTTAKYVYFNTDHMSGIRFPAVTIPQGATIISARMQLRSDNVYSDLTNVTIQGEASDNPVTFNSADATNLSTRPLTTAFVPWEPAPWVAGGWYWTPDLKSIVQEQVNRAGWLSGNSLAFLFSFDSGAWRKASTFEETGGVAPRLEIVYQASGSSTTITEKITSGNDDGYDNPEKPEFNLSGSYVKIQRLKRGALRFPNVSVPAGATVTGAKLRLIASSSESGAAVTLRIEGEAADNAAAFVATANNLINRPKVATSVDWSVGDTWAGTAYESPDIANIVNAIVGRAGWAEDQAMVFSLDPLGDNNQRHFYDVENNSTRAAELDITYTTGGGASNEALTVGLRFQEVGIPQGATINAAFIEFEAARSTSGAPAVSIKGEAVDDAAPFQAVNNDLSSRPVTFSSSTWNPSAWNADDVSQTRGTSDLKNIVQEIVDRTNWCGGNDMAFLFTSGSPDNRIAISYDGDPTRAPVLRVDYDKSTATGCNTVVGGATTTTSSDETVRQTLKQIVNDFSPGGWTPLVDTYYEAAQYFRGEPVLYGKARGNQYRYGRLSHPGSYAGGTLVRGAGCDDSALNTSACYGENITGSPVYTSPITDSCQSNHIVLLTDGRANNNHSAALIKGLTGTTCSGDSADEACARDLATWLADDDQSSITDEQNITTHTIAFNLVDTSAVNFLKDVASNGDGSFQSANTATELVDALKNILSDVAEVDSSFISPGATVNLSNRLRHRNEVYFSLFRPTDAPKWAGNLKRYKLDGSAGTIVDSADIPAVNPVSGNFKDTAKSYWSDSVDGNDVTLGGAAGKLTLTGRKVYTYTGASGGVDVSLSDGAHALSEDNTAISDAMLGIDATVNKSNLLQWARGVDVLDADKDSNTTEVRQQLGDPLHSQPVIVSYDSLDTTVFFGTNEGYLHAVDGATGAEKFAFVPQELLSNLNVFYENGGATQHPYGLDGPITTWVKDEGIAGKIETGDHVRLYAGMRRGGRNLYALDVTNRSAPILKWTLNGGVGDFAELGQTWSKPILAKVKINSTPQEVLVFAGGYDPDQDSYSTRSVDDMGRAIFMVDPNDGSLVWSGGPDGSHNETFVDMLYSIPSDIRVIDMDVDGFADQLYVGDMGGQVWRFDINNGGALADLVKGGVIARVSDTTFAGNRRFFYVPDVSIATLDGEKFLSVAIGSGWRAHPLNTTLLTHADLHDATDNLIQSSDSTQSEAAISDLAGKDGWWMGFGTAGEKVLAESLTLENKVVFSSYVPDSGGSSCAADVGSGRVYAVSLFNATPVEDLDESGGDLTTGDRVIELKRDGIPPEPVVLFPSSGDPIVLVGSEQPVNALLDNPVERTFWRQEPSN